MVEWWEHYWVPDLVGEKAMACWKDLRMDWRINWAPYLVEAKDSVPHLPMPMVWCWDLSKVQKRALTMASWRDSEKEVWTSSEP